MCLQIFFFYHLKHIVWNIKSTYFSTNVNVLFLYLNFCAVLEKILSYEIHDIVFVPLLPEFMGLILVNFRTGKLWAQKMFTGKLLPRGAHSSVCLGEDCNHKETYNF